MRHIIDNLYITPGNDCLYSCIHNLFRFYHYEFKESDIFFMCNGMDVGYNTSDNIKQTSRRFIYKKNSDVLLHMKKAFSFHMQTFENFSSFTLYDKTIYHLLKMNTPLIVVIDPKMLPYNSRSFQMHTTNDTHCILLYGIDTLLQKAYIADSYVIDNDANISCYQGDLPLIAIIEGAQEMICLQGLKKNKETQILQTCVAKNIESFISPKKEGSILKGYIAILQCLEDIKSYVEMEESLFETSCVEVAYMINAHYTLILDYIVEMISEWNFCSKNTIDRLMRDINRCKMEWKKLYYQFLKIGFSYEKRRIHSLIERGIELVNIQNTSLNTIYNIIINCA